MTEQPGLHRALESAGLGRLAEPLLDVALHVCQTRPHGDHDKWQRIIDQLPDIKPSSCDFTDATVRIGDAHDCDDATKVKLKRLLLQLQPWRKGPFELFGVTIDSEWRADIKWARLAEKISCLRGRRVLDVGCGNGYYLWRMLGAGASVALGVDPGRLFVAQFNALKRYRPDEPAFVLPLTDEQFTVADNATDGFDTVFSMGVLSHRRDPRAHLRKLMTFVRTGGEVIIETLIVDGDADTVLAPAGRYAKMRNIYFIPSPPALATWLQDAGAVDAQLLNVSTTTPVEQRATDWMRFESLADFLDPADPTRTIEGHPAPQRAIFRCRRI